MVAHRFARGRHSRHHFRPLRERNFCSLRDQKPILRSYAACPSQPTSWTLSGAQKKGFAIISRTLIGINNFIIHMYENTFSSQNNITTSISSMTILILLSTTTWTWIITSNFLCMLKWLLKNYRYLSFEH